MGPESAFPYSGVNPERLHHGVMWVGEEDWAALFQAAKDAPSSLLSLTAKDTQTQPPPERLFP